VDFHAGDASGSILLVQVCGNAADPATLQRGLRPLLEAKAQLPGARAQLILLDPLPSGTAVPETIQLIPAIEWFLELPEN